MLLVSACYIFIAVSHMFFLPRLTELNSKAALSHNSIFKRKPETSVTSVNHINFFQRTDKFIVNDKKSAIDLMNIVISSFILLMFARLVWRLNPKQFFTLRWSAVNYQYSYLSFCTFKI
ncbi:hypothetical protein [Mucilaginibacter sp. SP1R1]|uniref:hypothetical protein n=1 Tax=Mucilaginibacter sp. SP1R1 TaxID=2723091 RepID=UPI00160B156B|nr:hypothetical protein [Mucilaginibacter sp. SP1R1]MBB6151751.1 hypothetical protein [Mucilaginibacter sp. SP1R1]